MCGILETTNVASQTVTAGNNIVFATNKIGPNCIIQHTAGSDTVTMPVKGLYEIILNADVTPTGSGTMNVDVQNNATDAISGTFTGTAAETTHISLDTFVNVSASCPMVSNAANITVLCGAACTVANADLIVKKVR